MKIIWSKFSKDCLRDIIVYYKGIAGSKVSDKIKSNIFSSTRNLSIHPESGQIEPSLKPTGHIFRYCLAGHYKIIYTIVDEGILITDVFDTRQDPSMMNKPERTK